MFGKHWMEMGALGCQGWKQGPDSSWTAALHYRYTWYGNKNKVPGLSKLFLVSLHEKHNFQGFSSHLNSKKDILVFKRWWEKSPPCSTSWSASAELAVFHLGQQSSINLHKAGSFCFQTDHEESYDLQIRISLALFQDANTAFSLRNIKIEWSSEEVFSTCFGYGSFERLSWLSSSF